MPTIRSVVSNIKDAPDFVGALTAGYFLQYQSDGTFKLIAIPPTIPGGGSGQLQYNASGTFGGTAAIVYSGSGSLLKVTAQAVGDVPLTVKGIAAQTGDLQEWQDSNANILAKILASGNLVVGQGTPNNTGLITIQHGAGTIGSSGLDLFNATAGKHIVLQVNSAGGFYFTDQAGAAQSLTLGTWQNPGDSSTFTSSAGSWYISSGALGINIAPLASTQLSVQTANATTKGVVVRGFTSQSADLQEWQNNTGTVLASIGSDGQLVLLRSSNQISIQNTDTTQAGFLGRDSTSGGLLLTSSTGDVFLQSGVSASNVHLQTTNTGKTTLVDTTISGNIVLTVKGATSQSGDLQQWQSSTGTVLVKIDSTGKIQTGSFAQMWTNGGEARFEALSNRQLVLNGNTNTVPVKVSPQYGVSGSFLFGIPSTGYVSIQLVSAGNTTVGEMGIDVTNQFYLKPGSGYGLRVISNTTNVVTIINKAIASQTSDLEQWQDSTAAILFGISQTGQLKTNQLAAATTLGSVIDKLPIYNAAGTLVGYIPVYNSIT